MWLWPCVPLWETPGPGNQLLVLVKEVSLTVFNINADDRLAIQAMRGAADSGVIGAHRHFYLV
jgi:hypothetical protein